uniref:E3 ubiquitin-protein ligase RFWD2 n=1 Tax=Tetraselmis sp. GSL018 TaxID=582737 RepID=A0A061S8J7_9CHLO|mmetsp:Transcript_19039/g.45445  ORF Transcript_19039/g.45445 Transcript_19039/m.45445 type:complete len:582 (+) Transcript_19039:506-2251(+)|eukprot:CAMPEP_0177591060 /NCGR_PEP_ID=MMETSP0419_2-20121207/7772_1 /TAXON_ID=582737 /ORGANISM="Tetraselmis sp., Strain GSL018" /LENGTH=581 /DNA_ID=CAMNT_0019081729 /DNA_START=441 /DNA_END=2186 /DNA_ORIENTATION=-
MDRFYSVTETEALLTEDSADVMKCGEPVFFLRSSPPDRSRVRFLEHGSSLSCETKVLQKERFGQKIHEKCDTLSRLGQRSLKLEPECHSVAAGAHPGVTVASVNTRRAHDSCDSSSCTLCHRRSFVDCVSDGQRKRSLSDSRFRPSYIDTVSDVRAAKACHGTLSHSRSEGDLLSLQDRKVPDVTQPEDQFEAHKRLRRSYGDWLRKYDSVLSDQRWGVELESAAKHTMSPVRAQFSEVCSLLPPSGSLRGEQRSSSKHVVQEMKVHASGRVLATATRAKQVCLYQLVDALQHTSGSDPQIQSPCMVHQMPSRVCSLSWSPYSHGLLTMGDHEGVLWQKDSETGHIVNEIDDHVGEKVWSVSHSQHKPHLIAASAGDSCVRLWDTSMGVSSCGVISTGRSVPVCSVAFSPHREHSLAMASADHSVYLYDIRRLDEPQMVLKHHKRPVSYVLFGDASRMVSSSIDGTVALWEGLDGANGPHVVRSFRDHVNRKNFTGLSVHSEQLIACGSEDGKAYAYFPSWDRHVASTGSGGSCGFVTSVQWLQMQSLGFDASEFPPVLAVSDSCGSIGLHALIQNECLQH